MAGLTQTAPVNPTVFFQLKAVNERNRDVTPTMLGYMQIHPRLIIVLIRYMLHRQNPGRATETQEREEIEIEMMKTGEPKCVPAGGLFFFVRERSRKGNLCAKT
jgi:hypothetical protein